MLYEIASCKAGFGTKLVKVKINTFRDPLAILICQCCFSDVTAIFICLVFNSKKKSIAVYIFTQADLQCWLKERKLPSPPHYLKYVVNDRKRWIMNLVIKARTNWNLHLDSWEFLYSTILEVRPTCWASIYRSEASLLHLWPKLIFFLFKKGLSLRSRRGKKEIN